MIHTSPADERIREIIFLHLTVAASKSFRASECDSHLAALPGAHRRQQQTVAAPLPTSRGIPETLPVSDYRITASGASPIPFRERSRLLVAMRSKSPDASAETVSAARRNAATR